MTIAIRRTNGDILWFDAVEGFDETLSSTVTKHPVATGAFVADHITKDNPRFTLRGVLSDADFNFNRPLLDYNTTLNTIGLVQDQVFFPSTNKQYVNNTPVNSPVSINSNVNVLKNFLPESISQFNATTIPQVVVTEQPKVKSAAAVREDLTRLWRDKETFTIVDFDNNLIKRSWSSCVLTSLDFSETPEGGDAMALFPVMGIEQVTFTDIENVKIKVKKPSNKGRQNATKSKRDEKVGDNAKTGTTEYSKKNSSQWAQGVDAVNVKPKFGDLPQ